VWEDGHTLRAGSVRTFHPTIKQHGMKTVASSRQLVQCVQSPGLTPAVACVANSRRQLVQEKRFVSNLGRL
jgi:hypothetical protein